MNRISTTRLLIAGGIAVGLLGLFGLSGVGRAGKAAPPPALSDCQCRSTSVPTTISTAAGPQERALEGARVAHCICGSLQCVATFYSTSSNATAISCR